ncbi:MAG TPA: PEP/pyruvate-binding domain-containing protein [Verrucomicrobiae bacterium]|nr:PEP/pyruvate-binding domain-containing protein [Verrucomicrobiae bacterium]
MDSSNSRRNTATRAATDQAAVLVLRLKEAGDKQLSLVGGKAFNLGKLIAAGLPVPPGFCVTTTAFDHFLASCPRRTELSNLLAQCSGDEIGRIAELSRKIRSCLAEDQLPEAVKDAVLSAWREPGGERSFAVRSSATVEDAAGISFAGQFETILNVRGADALLEAIKTCWLSLFSERALVYVARQRVPAKKVRMAVVVQEMVEAERAGVVFTADPLTGATDRLVVECVSGLGEGLVQGTVQPERMVVEKRTGRVLALPENKLLSCATLKNLCDLARQTERLFGSPQDIEWAQRDGALFLLQSRPITTKAPVKTWEDRQVWSNFNTGEVMPDVMTPITWSLWQSLLGGVVLRSASRLLGADARHAPLVGLVAGRLYFNANTPMAALKPFSFLLKNATDVGLALGGGQVEAYRQVLAIPPEDLPDLGFRWPKYILSWPRILFDLITHLPRQGEAWIARFKTETDERVRVDVEAISTPELVRLCVRLIREPFKGVDLLYLATPTAVLPVLHKACRDWLGEPEPALGYRLFSALGGMPTAEAGLALWRLAVLARADRDTEAAVSSESNWPQVRDTLQRTESGRRFLAAWHIFMAEHGHHCRGELELFNARWSETPDYVLGVVRGYLRSIGQSDPLENQRQLAGERERLTEQCRRRLENPIKRWIFSWSLRRAQKLAVFREELKNQFVRRFAFMRRVLLALGQRLPEHGSLSCRDDIFFLEISEIEPVATGSASFDWRERIALRRREYEKNLKLTPPPFVVGKFDPNAPNWPVANADAKLLTGIPVSPGIVTGPARVILRADNHEQVLVGEILVAPFTDPAWSPYFIAAAGLVVEQGGMLSHGSIVAREYGLPAVTNVAGATRVIRTGDLVRVDGNRGCVSVLKRLAENSTAEMPQPTNP